LARKLKWEDANELGNYEEIIFRRNGGLGTTETVM